ncbi:MAG: hypothetical protein QXR97_07225, partial [Thermoproteota archaeon]
YRIRNEDPDQCYVEFMKTMQEIARGILQQKTISEIQRMHQTLLGQSQLVQVFGRVAVESLPKMLDECNYVKFRQGLKF